MAQSGTTTQHESTRKSAPKTRVGKPVPADRKPNGATATTASTPGRPSNTPFAQGTIGPTNQETSVNPAEPTYGERRRSATRSAKKPFRRGSGKLSIGPGLEPLDSALATATPSTL